LSLVVAVVVDTKLVVAVQVVCVAQLVQLAVEVL
jgi:hypothetical protein